jgi:hypothetical protein
MRALVEEAVANGARRAPACAVLGVSVRTLERWRAGAAADQRQGPRQRPANALTAAERTTCQGSPSFTQLAITQVYAPRFLVEVGGPPGVGSSDAVGVGVLRS